MTAAAQRTQTRSPGIRERLRRILAAVWRIADELEPIVPLTAEDWGEYARPTWEGVVANAPTALQFAARPLTEGEQEAIADAPGGCRPPDDEDDPNDDLFDDDDDFTPQTIVMYAHLMRREAKARRLRR